jgi:hypothetical protein
MIQSKYIYHMEKSATGKIQKTFKIGKIRDNPKIYKISKTIGFLIYYIIYI